MGTESRGPSIAPGDVVTAFLDVVWNQGDLTRVPEFIAPGYQVEGVAVGPAWVQENVATYRAGFSGLRMTVERMLVDGPQVAALVRVEGCHTGIIKGFAGSNRAVSYREAGFWDVDLASGRIVAGDFVADTMLLRLQMGVASPACWHGSDSEPAEDASHRD